MSDGEREFRGGGAGACAGAGEGDEAQKVRKVRIKATRKLLLLFRLPFRRRFTKINNSSRGPSPPYVDVDHFGNKGVGLHPCCFMMRRPRAPPIDPSASTERPVSYSDLLRSMLENNHFYSADCNVHRDI